MAVCQITLWGGYLGKVSELIVLIVPLILLSFHLQILFANGIYILYAYIIAFLKNPTINSLATFFFSVSNISPNSISEELPSRNTSLWKHINTNLGKSFYFVLLTRQ